MKLVGESFPFTKQSQFFYLRINHNSVLGIRYAKIFWGNAKYKTGCPMALVVVAT